MVSLTQWNPAAEMPTLTRDPFFRRFWSLMDADQDLGSRRWMPDMSVYETKDELIVRCDIPGIDPKDVEINLQGEALTIRAERKAPEESDDVKLLQGEHLYGRFERTIRLPLRVEADKVKAKAELGVMTIHLPKASEHVGRVIPVETD